MDEAGVDGVGDGEGPAGGVGVDVGGPLVRW